MTETQVITNNFEFIIPKKDLVHALNFASAIVEKRNVSTELSSIKLCITRDAVQIFATDYDLYLKQTLGAEIITTGETTVSMSTLHIIARKISDDEIHFKHHPAENKLEITGKNYRFELLTLPADKFPVIENIDSEITLDVACKDFSRILEYTAFAMSLEETRYNLNGVYLHIKNGGLYAAATDAHRLSVASTPINSNEEFGVILPRKTVEEVKKIAKDSKNTPADMQIILGASNKIQFNWHNTVLVSKLIDAVFPDYTGFIPLDNNSKLEVNTRLFLEAIDRVATVTVDKFRAIKMSITGEGVAINAFGEAKGIADEFIAFSEEESNFCKFDGEGFTMGFNPEYLIDALNVIEEERVNVWLKDPFSPVLIKTEANPNDCFVIMPVKV